MSFRENPVLLRQSFVKLWPNNIYLQEESDEHLQFISLYQTKLMTETLLHYRYTRLVSTRTLRNETDFDEYINFYKYQKNERRKKKRRFRHHWNLIQKGGKKWREEYVIDREPEEGFLLPHRFIKMTLYQQLLQEFGDLVVKLLGLLFRIREPIRRLSFMNPTFMNRFRRSLGSIQRQKHFINTVHQVILLHYYKATSSFTTHFGRELEKVHKKVHWKLIFGFKGLLSGVPTLPKIRRQFYGLLIEIAGRPKGRGRTFVFRMSEGSLAPQTYSFRISYGTGEALAKVGSLGVKTWIAY